MKGAVIEAKRAREAEEELSRINNFLRKEMDGWENTFNSRVEKIKKLVKENEELKQTLLAAQVITGKDAEKFVENMELADLAA